MIDIYVLETTEEFDMTFNAIKSCVVQVGKRQNKKDGYRQLNVRQVCSLRPGTIAVNVTWIEREFNACQTARSMYHLSSTISEI